MEYRRTIKPRVEDSMAAIKIQAMMEHLDSDLRSALKAALSEVLPDYDVDVHELFGAFTRAVGHRCETWESVPDDLVRM